MNFFHQGQTADKIHKVLLSSVSSKASVALSDGAENAILSFSSSIIGFKLTWHAALYTSHFDRNTVTPGSKPLPSFRSLVGETLHLNTILPDLEVVFKYTLKSSHFSVHFENIEIAIKHKGPFTLISLSKKNKFSRFVLLVL